MRNLIVLPLLVAGSFAGTTPINDSAKAPVVEAKAVKNPIVPSVPLAQWFAGGTAGYLMDAECEFFSGHVGRDLDYKLGGWDTAAYLEVGYFGCEMDMGCYDDKYCYDEKYDDKKYDDKYYEFDREQGGRSQDFRALAYDLDVIPVTLNYKLERQITRSLNAYVGVGAGVAFMDLDTNFGQSDDDVVFFAQAFAGVLHNVSENWEIYGGGRVIYFDDPSFDLGEGPTDLDLDNVDGILEVGARYNF